jgi:hypothetical protein
MVALAGGDTMHPDMIRAIADQHIGDLRAEARAGFTARLARQARRARRNRRTADPLAGVRVPDYIDGTFHEGERTSHGHHAETVR